MQAWLFTPGATAADPLDRGPGEAGTGLAQRSVVVDGVAVGGSAGAGCTGPDSFVGPVLATAVALLVLGGVLVLLGRERRSRGTPVGTATIGS